MILWCFMDPYMESCSQWFESYILYIALLCGSYKTTIQDWHWLTFVRLINLALEKKWLTTNIFAATKSLNIYHVYKSWRLNQTGS